MAPRPQILTCSLTFPKSHTSSDIPLLLRSGKNGNCGKGEYYNFFQGTFWCLGKALLPTLSSAGWMGQDSGCHTASGLKKFYVSQPH